MADERELEALRDALVFGLRAELSAVSPGFAAFERHQLLAIRFHRASRLNAPGIADGKAWQQYFDEHFPRGGEHGGRLWEDWRGRLVKDEFPGPRVAVSHGQPHVHWKLVDSEQRLFLNLESLWDDFEQSVESFVALLASDEERKRKALEKWRKRRWSVQQVIFTEPPPSGAISTASVSSSVASSSAWFPPPEPR